MSKKCKNCSDLYHGLGDYCEDCLQWDWEKNKELTELYQPLCKNTLIMMLANIGSYKPNITDISDRPQRPNEQN